MDKPFPMPEDFGLDKGDVVPIGPSSAEERRALREALASDRTIYVEWPGDVVEIGGVMSGMTPARRIEINSVVEPSAP